jgi:hypothetical protein
MCENSKIGRCRQIARFMRILCAFCAHEPTKSFAVNATKGSGLATTQEPQLDLTSLQLSMDALIVAQIK